MSRDELFLDLATSVARRSTCERGHVGAILVQGSRVLGIGYNGSPPGCVHCSDVGCLIGSDGRCKRTIHAEINALVRGAGLIHPQACWKDFHRNISMADAILYVTGHPCLDCLKAAIAAGVRTIKYRGNFLVAEEANNVILFLLENKGVIDLECIPVGQIEESKL